MALQTSRFPTSEMIALVSQTPRFDLAESVGPNLTIAELFANGDLSELSDLELGYGTAQGSAQLRDLIAQQLTISSDDIVTTTGGMHALFLMSTIVCDESAHVVTLSPQFPLATDCLHLFGAEVTAVRSRFEDGYCLPIEEMAQVLKPNTRLVCIASPQNPSGVLVPDSDLVQLIELMQGVCPEAYLLIDETYRQACYDAVPCTPSASELGDRVVCVTSLSKCHGAPGLRTGWISTRDRDLLNQLIAGKFQSIISSSTIDEALAIRVLMNSGDILAQRRTHLGTALRLVEAWVHQHEELIDWVEPDRGALCCIRLKRADRTQSYISEFYRNLEQSKVRVAPGNWFGDEAAVFRLGFGFLTHTDLSAGLSLLSQALHEVNLR
ncbi:MAG: aminotransferase class I/II-fold pyridoxal phosphate-dependent enzyme [Granulosicoccus sp.]